MMLLPLLLLAPLQVDPQVPVPQPPGPIVQSLGELVTASFRPERVDAERLEDLLHGMIGRSYFVTERGGLQSEPVDNIWRLGDQILIHDSRGYVERVLELCRTLDQLESAAPASTVLTTLELRPRYVTIETALEALRPFGRLVEVDGQRRDNIHAVLERSLLVVRDTAENLAEMTAVLERVDQPRPQVLFTCTLLAAGEPQPRDPALPVPQDLAQHLDRLLPGVRFSPIGFSVLRSSVAPGAEVRIRIEGARGVAYTIEMRPVAYDPETGALTVSSCELHSQQSDGTYVEEFGTSAVFRRGESTVLGSTGDAPVFLVVRVESVP